MRKVMKTVTGLTMALAMVCGVGVHNSISPSTTDNALVAEAAGYHFCTVKTGCFNGNNWSGWTAVYPDNSRKSSKIKVCAFRQNGKINSGKFKVDVYSGNWNYVKTVEISGSGYITLNSGYDSYYVRIKRTNTGADNVARTQYWSIDATTNCGMDY